MDKITKRLHISGLTPSITKEDLQRRLSSFGTVKALDGFGLLDAVGRPRKFGYITIETTAPQLAKCLNLLSGTTWKGTKLRLGDAKPDFRERLARERDAAEPPRKRRRRGRAEHAEDMSLVTSENVGEKRGWKVMPSGRMVHPLRMKPSKPLAPRTTLVDPQGGKREGQKKVKSRVKPPPTRARRRLIDPTAWGSTHLKGDLLDVIGNGQRISEDVVEDVELGHHSDADESDEDSVHEAAPAKSPSPIKPPQPQQPVLLPNPASTNTQDDLATEKANTLRFLQSHFGGMDEDWMGSESVGSDVDVNELPQISAKLADLDNDTFEEVPMALDNAEPPPRPNEDAEMKSASPLPQKEPKSSNTQSSNLKKLFSPQEQDTGFSLLGNLGIDLELDEDVPFPTDAQATLPYVPSVATVETVPLIVSSAMRAPIVLDPKKPLFFPLSSSFPFESSNATQSHLKARALDIFDVATEKRCHWRHPLDPSSGFWRTETEEQIRKRWEGQKVELTRDWKRRWREAVKLKRRRGAGDAAE